MNSCAHHLLEEYATTAPDEIAIVCDDCSLTFGDLNHLANRQARALLRTTQLSAPRVGLYGDRSINLIVALFAILKAGGAYVFVDSDLSIERRQEIARNARLDLILFDPKHGRPPLEDFVSCISLDSLRKQSESEDPNRLSVSVTVDSLACITYTSGTTGRPKGIEHNHSCLTHYQPQFGELAVCALNTSLGFTSSFARLFAPLGLGIPVVIFPSVTVRDVRRFVLGLESHRVTTIGLVPSLLKQILEIGPNVTHRLSALKEITVGGEALTSYIFSTFRTLLPNVRLLQGFGSSETCAAMLCDLTTRSYADINCIGNPLPNTVAVILDNNLRKVPVGSVGRLYIGGPGLARGYVGNSDNEGFITNPFDISLAPLFGTRDLTKYRPNGEIELVGRLDDQVKIKGYRVNLRELELAIEGHRKVKQAAVLLRTEHEEVRVIAYVMPKEPLSSTELREFMRSQVADHLLPIRFIMVSHFPLTPSGKVAKNEFPSPALSRPNLDVAYREPTDQLEADLSSIWAQVLNVDDIGIDDDFLELGGDSLTGIRLAGIIQSHYGIELNMRDILTWPTIALFSQFVRKSLKSNALSQDKYVNPDS